MKWLFKPGRQPLTEGNILAAVGRLATPMLIGAVLQNIQSLIDLFWVGSLGSPAVASVAMAGTILMVLFPMLMGLAMGTVALVARCVGAGRLEEASAVAGQSLMLALILGGLSAIAGWYASDPLFRLLRAAPEVVGAGGVFLRISLLGSFTMFVLFIGNAALQGAGDTITPMQIMAISNVLNIVLEPIFIFGWGPMSGMGVRGAALATVLAQAAAAGVSVYVLFKGRARLHIRWTHWKPNPNLAWRILRIGIPGSGQMLSRSLTGAVLMGIVAGCGTAAVAAYGIGLRFHMIILMPAFALGGAAATLVGQNLGAGQPERANRAAWVTALLGIGFMALTAVILMGTAPALVRVFNSEPEVVQIGAQYLRTVSPFYVFAALAIALGRALNGAGDSLAPMICTVLALWGLQVPLAILLSRVWNPPTQGIWWAIVIAMTVHGLLVAKWFQTGRWRRQRV
ncbi:MAG: MATE family efflux transporter [Verrucomicrobia bacterium]|nr:MATE family efflux transporter [Verrucomicrobiota bacterium]MBU4247014.1 MATE family efflux transporter [Verrucomicrobiota bacterium]MBU4290336.1 MATE family efflux transporter [Verrucomicrobiota bacterium]MBU4429129.1 MATE family efflux transporter [Verrucomicrobiota bacterium]MCG2681764.1 MATE family efflux transporter [Kiritimatiellia bacterium]